MKLMPITAFLILLAILPWNEIALSATESDSSPTPADMPKAIASADEADSFFTLIGTHGDSIVTSWNQPAIRKASRQQDRLTVRNFPLRADLSVDLELEPFSVTSPSTRFVLGRKLGADQPIEFDPSDIALFRGSVVGLHGSHVFLALSEGLSTGTIDLGPGKERYQISSRNNALQPQEVNQLTVFKLQQAGGSPLAVPLCGVSGHHELDEETLLSVPSRMSFGVAPAVGLKHLELAIETDYEYFILHGNVEDAATYLVEMYAQVSDIFMRDVDTRMELVFARIWDNPDDLFNGDNPLGEFRNYWNKNMQDVQRDVAQLFSGRRDYPFGGQAYLSSLCGPNGYSVIGYALGFFPDPTKPSPYHYDIFVTAHELGHSCGTGHTHSFPNNLDTCDDPDTTPQRGTIMSYCQQTWSGQSANQDLYFHTVIQQNMDDHIGNSECVVPDCNMNSIDDSLDIDMNTSSDVNSNGVPDECEDCNDNGVLDDEDIATGASMDLNGNGVPDDCEPDCNNNQIPDDLDIADETSEDLYGNGMPDECESDCNGDFTSDYTEIQADMTLDVDRNTILDSCQDCDGDRILDMEALSNSHNLWMASGLEDSIVREFYATTGVLTQNSSGGLVNQGQDLIIAPDGRVLVTSGGDHRVMQFDQGGNFLGDLVTSGAGGLDAPAGLLMTPDGILLVASRNTNSVLAFDGTSGLPLGEFIAAGDGGLSEPFGMTFGPNGNLLVTSSVNEVLEYDGQNGSFVGIFVSVLDNAGLDQPRGLTFKSDGNLLVTSFGSNETLEFDGQTGAALGKWAQVGTATSLTQISPWGIRVGPNGNVFVVRTGEDYGSGGGGLGGGGGHDHGSGTEELHFTNAQIYEFDARNGNFVRTHIGGNDHELLFPTAFDFVPGWDIDCNLNLLPDECDIASGFSQDQDHSGVPDECEVDCNDNGVYDRFDIIPFGSSRDCNVNGVPDECDVANGESSDSNGNGILDQCEALWDLDGDGDVDAADLALLLGSWGSCPGCPADFNADGEVNAADLALLLGHWGPVV